MEENTKYVTINERSVGAQNIGPYGTININHYQKTIFDCPKCKVRDRVQKVSVVVETNIGSKLTLPAIPKYESPWRWYSVVIVLLAAVALIYFVYAFITITPQEKAHPTIDGIIVYIIFICIGVATLLINIFVAKERKKAWRDQRTRRESALDMWDKLYYCSRDDVIFIPGEALDRKSNTYVPASQMIKILYSQP